MHNNDSKNAIIISISSDLGSALAEDWIEKWNIYGTYRKLNDKVVKLQQHKNIQLFECDLLSNSSIEKFFANLLEVTKSWDAIIFAAGSLEPIGEFINTSFEKWEECIQINLLKQLMILHKLLPYRNISSSTKVPTVLFFAGGGTNNAVNYYSGYTLSKIGLIKMCELLDSEISDARFVILGPGWVRTKIHEQTIKAGYKNALNYYENTLQKINNNKGVPINKVVECCNWILSTNSKSISGRNFSVEYDNWGSAELENKLQNDPNMYKLRRFKN